MKENYPTVLGNSPSTEEVEAGHEVNDERAEVVAKAMAAQYRRASKGEKGLILDRFVEATG